MNESTYDGMSLGAQSDALTFIANVAREHPSLPPAYIVSSSLKPGALRVQLDSAPDVEQWRTFLHVAPEDVVLKEQRGDRYWLEFTTKASGFLVHAYASIELAKPETEGAAA
jgi:hypothetical protein